MAVVPELVERAAARARRATASTASAVSSSERRSSVRTCSRAVSPKTRPRALKTPGSGGDHDGLHLKRARDLDADERPVPAERADPEVAWVAAPVRRDGLHGSHHRGDRDREDPVRGLERGRRAARRPARRSRGARRVGVEDDVAADEPRRVHVAEHDERVGQGRLRAASSVTDRPWIGAGARAARRGRRRGRRPRRCSLRPRRSPRRR